MKNIGHNSVKSSHVCKPSNSCCCSLTADEPDENCPVHGMGEYPPRCGICGRFIKLQVTKNYISGWISPEQRMKTYADYGIGDDIVPKDDPRWKKVKWVDFRIVVPDEETKQQLLAAFEYIHDNNSVMNNDFIAVNAVAHAYVTSKLEKGHPDRILVNPMLFNETKQQTCVHTGVTYSLDGVDYCKDCDKPLRITSYRN